MIVPLIWLKDYISLEKSPQETAEDFTALGLMLDKPIQNDVLDLEHRMDRSDWLSMLGCARDLAAFQKKELKLPERYNQKGKEPLPEEKVEIKVECPDLVNRFNTRVFRNVKVHESPQWLKERLEKYGIPSINNIVDITNYVMVEYGQPMHAQDLAKFEKKEILIRRAEAGEKITTLDGTEVELDNSMFVLTQSGKPIALGGIVGGQTTGVTSETTDIVLDAGNYNQANIRATSRKVKIQNETVARYDKFLHPKLCEIALERATKLILELAGGEYYENEDWYPTVFTLKKITLHQERIKMISGAEIPLSEAKDSLSRLDYRVLEENSDNIVFEVPYFRTDVEIEDDLIADILRIRDYKNIESQKMDMAPPWEITPRIYKFEEKCRDVLVKLGLHEHITDPLVSRDENIPGQVVLSNSQSSEKNALRTSLYQTLFPVTETYAKHGATEIGVFEIGKIYFSQGTSYEDYREERVVEIIYTSNRSPYEQSKKVKQLLFGFLENMGIYDARLIKEEEKIQIYQENIAIGEIRHNSFALYTEKLMDLEKKERVIVSEYSNNIYEDITIVLPIDRGAGDTFYKIKNCDPRIGNVEVVDMFLKDDLNKAITLRIEFLPPEEGILSTQEVAQIKEEKIFPLLNLN